ncbi:UNVERIFIED_CONTAM: Aspartic proteinase-like protein 2 [Sesamum angustifolium]|uniref:Aspartic proteinase-like protein 2 n=1 Tax=Sesamum angustifolium TaxID=2727405 RepID=A0AAW2ILT2_9LAMI
MVAQGFLLMVAVVAMAAAAVVSALKGGGGFQGVLTLERAFPVEGRVELEAIKARDRARHARMLQRFPGGIVDFTVGGTSDPYAGGLYYTKVRLGSPPQEFNVQIDTGSDVLWVTCNSCNDCPQNSGLGIPLNFFDAATSSSVSPISCSDNICASMVQLASAECSTESNQCGYSFQYGDGSDLSNMELDFCNQLDNCISLPPTVLLCSTSLFGDLTKSDRAVDGIFGFGQQGLSVISQLSSLGITPKVFSLLERRGPWWWGGGFHISIAVNGQLLPIDQAMFTTSGNQGTIVDSGTTLAYLVEGAYDPLVAALLNSNFFTTPLRFSWVCRLLLLFSSSVRLTTSKGNQCYLVSTSLSETFPAVSFNFAGGASMVLRPIDYLVLMGYLDGAAMWCIGFLKVQNEGTTILGDLVLKDKIFVYDLAHQRIGWADYDCSLSVNVSITSGKDEYVNAGQLSVSRSSSTTDIFKTMHKTFNALMLHILVFLSGFSFCKLRFNACPVFAVSDLYSL